MHNALQTQTPIRGQHAAAERFGRSGRTQLLADLPGASERSANDAEFARPASVQPASLRVLAADGAGETAPSRERAQLTATALEAVARSRRAAGLVALHRAMFSDIADGVVHLLGRLRRWSQAGADEQALLALDDRILRDIGLTRCEVGSISHENAAAATRVLAAQSPGRL